ncbi:MAG: hypothetical protein LH629_11480 [Ignavibacteria bacterium]|nr:hypothetical protein [Ignavibacteria bacterium]
MKTLILIIFFIAISGISYSQNVNWSTIEYHYSKGPVSPEYQYSYDIIITKECAGNLIYSKGGNREEYPFSISKKGMKKLKKSLKNSQVFIVDQNSMNSDNNKIGGPEKNIVITMWQSPDLDQKPTTKSISNNVKEEYINGIDNLYLTIENLVPKSIRDKIKD